MSFLILAELGSFGSSWCPTSSVTLGWLSPKASAVSPARSTLDWKVTSKLPVSRAVSSTTDDGATEALPRVTENGVWKSSPCQLTWWRAIAWRPAWAGAATKSSAPPVAVLNCQTPEPMCVLGLAPSVSMVYGPPKMASPTTWKWFTDLPMISVSISVYGAVPSHSVRARKSEPSAGSAGTSRKKNRQSPDSARQVQSLAPKTDPLL